jgi:hypothetical protein
MKRLFTILVVWLTSIVTSKILLSIFILQADMSGSLDRSITYFALFPLAIALAWSVWQVMVFFKKQSQKEQPPPPTEDVYKRFFITLMVWLASISACIGVMMLNDQLRVAVALIFALSTIMWTGLSWKHPARVGAPKQADIPYKMALLLEMMDEDEREAFKQQLKRDILASETGYEDFDRLALEETEKRKRG